MFKIGFLIYTFDRVEDAKINQKIIRELWGKSHLFADITIVHAFNGPKKIYPEKYLEDDLVTIENSGHYQGAAELIDAGIKTFQKNYSDLDYVIVLAADTWVVKPHFVDNILYEMAEKNQTIASCAWGSPLTNDLTQTGMATDFFIVDLKWATKYKMFPLDYQDFKDKYWDFLLYQYGTTPSLEKLAWARFMKAVAEEKLNDNSYQTQVMEKFYRIKDREPVNTEKNKLGEFHIRKHFWPEIGLLTDHDLEVKKGQLEELEIIFL